MNVKFVYQHSPQIQRSVKGSSVNGVIGDVVRAEPQNPGVQQASAIPGIIISLSGEVD